MKIPKNKKGFTIVELTIVIAVIAILAAVLIPTFTGLVKKADRSADVQMVVNLNKYLAAMENLDGKNETMADAMADAAETGYGLDAFRQDGDITILWNRETDRFLAVEDGKIITADETVVYTFLDYDTYKTKEWSDKKNEEPCKNKGIYWAVSDQISDTYATYLTDNSAFSSGEPVEIKLGLDTTAYEGDYQKIKVEVVVNSYYNAVILNGVFYSVNSQHAYPEPVIYGYVNELDGDAESKNATFHMKPEEPATQSEGGEDTTGANVNGTITGSYIVDHLVKQNGGCHFCTSSEVQEYKHTHEWTKNDGLSKEPTCKEKGCVYYQCSSSTTCQAIKVEELEKVDHKYESEHDNYAHWEKCSDCEGFAETDYYGNVIKEAHSIVRIGENSYKCENCDYVAEEAQCKVYEKAVELNNNLGTNTYPTMYDTFFKLANCSTNDTDATINSKIKGVISGIDMAEGSTGLKILWDQTIGKFVVVHEEGSTYCTIYVLYTPDAEHGVHGSLSCSIYSPQYTLWDTYGEDENYQLTINTYTNQVESIYSVYWAGTDMPSGWKYEIDMYLYVGFDMGTWQPVTNLTDHLGKDVRNVFNVMASGTERVIIRTNCGYMFFESDGNSSKIKLQGTAPVHHYGNITEVDFHGSRGPIPVDGKTVISPNIYYEHGSVTALYIYKYRGNYTYSDTFKHTFWYEDEQPTFKWVGDAALSGTDETVLKGYVDFKKIQAN